MDILVQRDPVEALSVADRHRRDPDRPAAERAVDEWAAGRSELELGDAERAVASLRRAVELATDAAVDQADRPLVARFRISLALALAEVGRTAAALAQLRAAAPDVDADGRPRLLAQRSLVLLHAGRLREADEAADGAVAAAVANGDRLTEARSLVNRGIVRLQAGQLAAAETDLRAAAELADALDQRLMAAAVLHDLALVYARRGEIPRALEAFADAAGAAGAAGLARAHAGQPGAGPGGVPAAGRALGGGGRVVGPGRGAGRQLRQRGDRGRGGAAARRRAPADRGDR